MAVLLNIRPVNLQVRYRPSFSPPNYGLVKNEIALAVAKELAGTFNLKSTSIAVNQNAISGQFLSLRYVLPIIADVQPRYFDALIGVDQAEVLFVNPSTLIELKSENMRIWNILINETKPIMSDHLLEATLHCTTEEGSATELLNTIVALDSGAFVIQKGFTVSMKQPKIDGNARISLEMSTVVPDGLYINFGCVSASRVESLVDLENLLDEMIAVYRGLQSIAHVQIMEPR